MIAENRVPRINVRLNLINELFEDSVGKRVCEHVRRDDSGRPYCANGLKSHVNPSSSRYDVCDTASLQLWCLSDEGFAKCIYYKGEPLD
ncbi:MAG: hypothetical protein KC506_01640 [Nanoarchaeota archaeon]|nr:hypothetical protein [Nanoarchaeota archaeon]